MFGFLPCLFHILLFSTSFYEMTPWTNCTESSHDEGNKLTTFIYSYSTIIYWVHNSRLWGTQQEPNKADILVGETNNGDMNDYVMCQLGIRAMRNSKATWGHKLIEEAMWDKLVRKSHSKEVALQPRPAQNEGVSWGTACREQHARQREQYVRRPWGGAGSVCVRTSEKMHITWYGMGEIEGMRWVRAL